MPDQKSYYIEVDGQDPIVVDEEQFNTGKDDFYKDYPEARVSEVTSYKHGETTLDPGDAVSVNVEGQDPITLAGDRFLKGADDFYKDYPEAQVMRIRPTGTWGDNIRKQYSHQNAIDRIVGEEEYQATDEARAALAEKERRVAELRSQLDSYNKKAKEELDAIPGQNDRIIAQSKQMPKRKELEAQLKEAERSVNTDPVTLGQNAMGKKSATKGNEKLDELIAPLKEQIAKDKQEHRYMPALGGVGSVPVGVPKYEENLYLAGKNLNNEAIRTYEAPSKYQPVGGPGYNQTNKKSGFNEFMRGAGERASEADFWTMGMSGMVDQFALKDLFGKIRSEFGDMDEITDENIDEKLTPLEQEVLAAFFRNADAQARRAGDISNAYQAGRSAADSLEFMAEFALSGAVTGALGKAALKASPKSVQSMAKWIGKKLGKETPASIGKGALQVGTDVFKGVANTFFQPGTYKAMYEAMNQVDPETGKFVNQSKAAWNAIFDRGIENFSERTGDYIGNVLGFGAGAVGGKKLLDKVANTEIGKWGRAFYNSEALKMLKAGGWNGYFGEMSEEFIGAALRSATGLDPDAWKEQWDKDNIAVMAMSFLPMSIFGGTVSTVKYGAARKNLADSQEKMPAILQNLGFSEEQIAHAMDLTQMSTPEKIRETIKPIVDVMASRGASKEDQDALMNYAIAAATVNAYDGYESEKVQRQRNATLAELQENYGDFWQENGEDERTVERVTLPDGRSGYVLDTDETGMMSVKWDDGSVSFTDAEHGAQTGIYSLDQYLDGIILTEDRAREAASMQEEEMQGRQELAQKIEANEPVPMGTDEAPVNGTYVGRDQQGNNIIQLPDGQTLLSDEELAAKWGINIQPKTEEQKEADATAEYEAMQMRKNAYNTIPRGAEVEAHLEGLDQPVKYKFTRALYDEDEQELKIFVEDENGEERSLPESAFPDLSLAASQYSQQQEIAEEQTPAAEAQQDVPRDFRGNPLPLKQDGSVNQTDLWNNDPEAWAAWNDSQRRDGGANSRNYVQAAVNTVQSEIESAQKQYAKELDFDKREAIEKQIADKQNRLNTLNGVLSGYNAREEAAKNAVEEAAVQQEAAALAEQEMTPEQAAEAAAAEAMRIEAERQKPLEKRAKAWEERTGQKVTVIHNFDEVPESEVTARASLRLGLPVTGWYSTSQGHVMLYVPNIKDESEIDKTYMHEVISHKGLREMLGKERFDELMDHTWNDIMSEADRKRFSDYVQMTWPDAEGDALRRAAADEYIANLAENIDTNPTAWEKFVAKVKEILEKILGTELKITDADLKTLLQASLARYEAQAQEGNPEISARLSDVGIASTGDETRFSVKYAPKTEAEADSIAADIAAQVGVSKAMAKRWVKSETSLADIIGTKENQPYLDYTGDDRYTAIKENSDYPQGTVDFNNICRKRLAFTDMYQRIQKAFPNVIITGEDLAKIRNIMKSHGLTVACGLCYVEDRRQLLGEIAKDFIDNYNGNFEEYASRGGEAKKKNADKFRKLIGEDRKDDLSIYDLITLSGSAKLYEEHPGIYNAFQAFNNARGQQSGNLFQGYAEYKREILKWSKARVKRVNDNGGLRVFSYSDFEAHHLIDLVQIIQDCARKGVKIQGYTKVPAFARAVSETGIKLNRSLIPLGDTGIVDGKLAYDPVEGIDVNDPNFLESNDNIGNILIGINDEQIRLAMADPFVHYIIPYHSNQREVLRSLKQTGAWTNYKPYQNEKDASGKTTLLNIYTDVIAAAEAEGKPIKTEKQFTEKFLQVCEEKGLTPRFEQFLDRKGGKYVYTPGYYKLLLDFKMFDENGKYLPQNPVVAKFDDAFNAQILNDYVKGEKEKFDGNLDDVYNEIVESLGLAGREQDVQPKTGDQILGEILESIDRKNAGQEEAQAENESEQMLFRNGDPSTEEGNTFFRISDGTLVGLHNISEDKLRKADKAGGLANPSAAVIDITKQEHNNFGEISLVMPSAMVSATSGKNGGTYLGDAWTPTFPGTQKKMSKAGSKAFDKQIMALPSDVRYNVENAFENYLEEDRDGNALRWWFLNETGRNPAIIHHESPYSKEDAKTIDGISEWDLKDEDIRTLADLYRKYASEEDVRKATTKFEPREEAKESVRKWMREYNEEIDKYGINVTSMERFLRQAKDQIRQDGRLDDYRTMDSARQFIEDNNLGEEFRSWLEGKEEEFGVETKLFAGWDRNGYKKWLDYTAENASKLMNKESGRNAYSDNGLSATHALLVRKMRTLAEIRKNKDLLVSRAEYDERYDQVDKELHSAISVLDGMQKISDNPFTNYDYTASRLQEALTHTNPVAYLNSEYKYSIPEDGEYAQQLEKLRKDIMEMPVNYFETKFNRPVGLSEFTSAVVPSNLDEKTRKILEDAGVTMFEYDPNQEGSRRDATMRATEQEGIRFRVANENQRIFVSNAEKAVEEMKMDKATPEQWKKTLEKNGGLKAAEDKWLGLSTWLDGLDRKTVTKQEILDFIAENQIKIEEQRYAQDKESDDEMAMMSYQGELDDIASMNGGDYVAAYHEMVERYGDDFEMAFSLSGESLDPNIGWNGEFDEATRYFLDQRGGNPDVRLANTTRLGYTTEGLTNKQEIALTVPTIEPWNEGDQIHFGDAGEGRAISWARFGDTWTSKAKDEAEKKYREADRAFRDYRKQIIAKYAEQNNGEADRAYWEFMRRFNDGHAPTREEQLELRQLEAARNAALPNPSKIRDLATPEENAKVKELQLEADRLYHEWKYGQHKREKVLVIDEIQSKRHQEGREEGYKNTPEEQKADKAYKQARNEREDYLKSIYGDHYKDGTVDSIYLKEHPLTQEQEEHLAELAQKERDAYNRRWEIREQSGSIPAAPFEKNWPELTMKRMLRYAAENGYDTVAWTTGEQQAERYSLSTVVDKVSVRVPTNRNGERIVNLYLRQSDGDYKNMYVDKDGVIIHGEYTGQKLSAVVGMDLATKIMGVQEGRQEFEGEDLKVGGEGMKGFYDDILPRFMNKYGKKWGVKVEDIYLPNLGTDADGGIGKGITMHSVPVTAEMKESVMQGQTMFRITPEQDKEYLDAVESGDMEKAGQMVETAAREAGYDSPKLYHGSDAFGFTRISSDAADDRLSFWATDNEKVAGSYTKLAITRKPGTEISNEDYEKAIAEADRMLDDGISEFRNLIDKHFSEWYFGQQGNEGIRKVIMDANHEPGYGDGVYDVLEDYVAEAYDGYGEDYEDEYEDFADWEENSREAQEIFDAINSLEGLREQLWQIENGELSGGIYELFANTDNMFVVDAEGKAWNELHPEGLPKIERGQYKDVPYKTRDVVKWAKEHGYDGVIFKNIKDNGQYGRTEPSDVYAFLNPQAQVKSADPVTYDDEGNVIPLSERFNPGNDDIRFRLAPNGMESNLTDEQYDLVRTPEFKRWFGDWENDPQNASKVLDENGEPRVLYHGGTFGQEAIDDYDPYVWEPGFGNGWFATNEKYSKYYVRDFNQEPIRVFLNIRNPFAMGDTMQLLIDNKKATALAKDYADRLGVSVDDILGLIDTDYSLEDNNGVTYRSEAFAINRNPKFAELLKSRGYDGAMDIEADGSVGYMTTDPDQIKSADAQTFDDNGREIPIEDRFSTENPDIRFRVVDDPLKIAELEAKPKVKVYRSMQEINGKLYPPMSARVDGEMRQPTELGVWEESEENPALADENGDFKLDKGNGKSLKAAYAPYFHSRRSPLNEQFSEAYNRPNLVIVEGEIPESELTSGYTAEKSKKSVGEHDWPSGKVSNALAKKGQDTRKVILSRWFKPVRVVPNSEVADMIMERMGDSDISFPYNVVTPSLREELAKRGARFDGWQGNKPADMDEQIARMEAENDAVSDNGGDIRFSIRGINGARNAKDEAALDNLAIAYQMDWAGKDMPTIWRATGWEKGTDGKWRNEIPDAKLKEGVGLGIKHKAGEILDAPELFDSYPQIADYDVYITKSSAAGGFNPNDNSITLDADYNTAFDDGVRVLTDEGRRTLLHELQHAIQNVEGFATGGSKGAMEKRYYQEEAKKNLPLVTFAFNLSRRNSTAKLLRAGRSEVIRQAENLDKSRFNKRDQEAFAELIEYLKGINDAEYASFAKKAARVVSAAKKAGEEGYHNLAGEVEARNVERRSKVPAKNRRQYAPSMTEDTPRDKQIVRFRIAYHGSPNEFEEFDVEHVGEGEGHQSHGWGIYVSLDEGTARRYGYLGDRDKVVYEGPKPPTYYAEEIADFIKMDMAKGESFEDSKQRMLDILKKAEENRKNSGVYWMNIHNDKEIAFVEGLTADDFKVNETKRNLYTVDIPDDTGENYIDEQKNLKKPMRLKIAEAIRALPADAWRISEDEAKLFHDYTAEQLADKVEKGPVDGEKVYNELSHGLGSPRAASEFLSDAGFVGIKYVGGVDGPCAVIFDAKDVEIDDHTRFRVAGSADDLVKRVQDYGLRGILDEDAAKAFWADAYAVMPEDARREIIDATFGKDADKQDLDIRRQTRAYVADLAKKGYAEDESGLLRYLADKLKEELGQDLDENTLRYLIWRSAKRYASNNLLDLAEDIAIRRRLGVGEFNGEKFPTGTSEAMDEAEKRIDEAESERDEARQATRRQARKTPYAALNSAMTAQRKYDQETVASVVALAKDMIKKGNIDKVSAREMARLMTIIKDANGRKPATVKAATLQLLDFMVDHTIGKEKELLDKVVKVRTAKVREPGVDTIAKLDLRAQNVVNSFRENYNLSEEEILRNISELEDKMADGRRTDASLEDMRSQLEGLNLALQYATEIGAKEADIRAIRQQMKDAKDEFDALSAEEKKKFRTSLNEELAAGEEMIRSKKIEEVDAYRRLRGDIAGAIDEGAERAKTFLEAERERVEQIHHWANSDMQGVPADVRDRNLTGWGKFANSSFAKLFTAPLANLDQMLRTLGRKTPEGRGYLWNWMMGAVRKASDDEKLGLDAAEKKLNDKVKEIFDDPKMEWNDLYSLERKMPKSKMTYFSANGEWVTEELTQGNLLYIYMVNKMTDGRMKLRQMNITEEDVQEIKKALDPRFVELADWVQEEFLPGLRDRYNETHKRLFGTSMASIENYFPLRILGGVIEEKRNVGDQEGKALPTDITGAIIKRTVNSKQLNLAGTDALSLVVEHLREMEHWNAYAEASRDFSTMLKYKRFQNQLKQLDTVYGAGKDLLDLFWDTVNLSVGAFRPKTTPTDKAFLNLAKGVTAAKISFRAYTAIKQVLSWPAFLADTNPLILAKNTLPINWKKNWDWAMENLPNFKKRVESRKAGLDILEDTSLDSKFWGTDFAKWINQNGMFMNAFVDALTVSIGAKSVYETKKARYIEEGFSEEEADKKAKYDAEVAYNETQQSSEKEFMSTMQAHRTVANVALSAYRNSSMGYQRQLHQALRTLNRMSRNGYKQESIEFMTKQLEREGLSEADAKKAAEDRYKRAGYQAAVRVAVFGWLVQFAWNLGAHAVYLLFGDDPDEKKAMLREDATHALVGGPIEGLAAGNIMSEAFNMIKNGENLRNWDPTTLPIMSDIKSTISKMSSDPVAGANDLVYLAAQIGLGTNPQTLSDAIVAIVDACDGDFETAREVMFCIMRILAVPQSQLDQLMIDEIGMKAKDARELSYEDVAKRYVDYKMKRNAPVTGKFYDEELRKKREKSLNTTFKKKYNERKKLKGEE